MGWEPKHAAAVGSLLVGLVVFAFVGVGVSHLLSRRAALGATSSPSPLIGAPAGVTAAIASGLVAYYVIWRHFGGGPAGKAEGRGGTADTRASADADVRDDSDHR